MVDFFASWCGPCRAQQPELNAVAARYLGRGVVIIGVGFRDGDAALRSYDADNYVQYSTVVDDSGDIAASMGVLAPPTTIVLDASQKVVADWFGGVRADSLGPVLDQLLKS